MTHAFNNRAPQAKAPPEQTRLPIRIGTRQSPLAMAQAKMTAAALRDAFDLPDSALVLAPVVASGDKITDVALREVGGKALWTRELDRALDAGEIDCAVHSMKDVETVRDPRFQLAALLPRADVRDVLVGADSIAAIPANGTLGTSSPRRAAQMAHVRDDVSSTLFRGNVATRLGKLKAGEADVTLLAAAGLTRLGESVGTPLDVADWLPAPSQGAIGIECRSDDADMIAALAALDDGDTRLCVEAERALLLALGGDCHSAVGALALIERGEIWLRAALFSEDGRDCVRDERRFAVDDADAPAAMAAAMLAGAPGSITRLFDGATQQE